LPKPGVVLDAPKPRGVVPRVAPAQPVEPIPLPKVPAVASQHESEKFAILESKMEYLMSLFAQVFPKEQVAQPKAQEQLFVPLQFAPTDPRFEEVPARQPKQPRKPDTRVCYNCGQVGHVSPQCPVPRKVRTQVSSTTKESVNVMNKPIPTYQTVRCIAGTTVVCHAVRIIHGVVSTAHSCLGVTAIGNTEIPKGQKWYRLGEDLAFCPVEVPGFKAIPLAKLRILTAADVGLRVGVLDQVNKNLSTGHVTGVTVNNGNVLIAHDLSTNIGSCGAPIVTEDGDVVGFHNADKTAQGVSESMMMFFRKPRVSPLPVVSAGLLAPPAAQSHPLSESTRACSHQYRFERRGGGSFASPPYFVLVRR